MSRIINVEGCCETCPIGGCCYWDECEETWKCVDTTKESCEAIGGNFQGEGYVCASGDCNNTICRPFEAGLPNDEPTDTPCFYQQCEEGWFSSTNYNITHACGTDETGPCADGDGCTVPAIGDTIRDTTHIACKTGGTYPSQVTVAGAVFNTGDAALDAVLSGLMNTTYTVPQVHCLPITYKYFPNVVTYGTFQFGVVAVVSSTGGGAGQTAGISIIWEVGGMGGAAYVGRTQTQPAYDTYTDCMGDFIDCNALFQLNGAANLSSGTYTPDITGATVNSSV